MHKDAHVIQRYTRHTNLLRLCKNFGVEIKN